MQDTNATLDFAYGVIGTIEEGMKPILKGLNMVREKPGFNITNEMLHRQQCMDF